MRNETISSILRTAAGAVAITLLATSLAFAGPADQSYRAVQRAQVQQDHPLQGATDWRERMQKNHSADRSIQQQVDRLTKDLDLTPEQQEKVRQLSKDHNDRIQKILDTAPATLTHEAFTAQVHAISQEYHDAVNAILTPHQLELMKAMVGRLNKGEEDRHAP
jgi:Spy/CpxP family protein refolding chaperone